MCAGYPNEFKDYMYYCRSLKFEQEPDYKTAIGFFENCMVRHNFDPNVFDYTWKKNRLNKEKENLRAGLTALISKTPRNHVTNKLLDKAEDE